MFIRKLLLITTICWTALFCYAEANDFYETFDTSENISLGIPGASDVQLHRYGFSLGYSHKYKQALWVSYILTKEHLQQPQIKRSNKFSVDPAITKNPVIPNHYNKTGYDRGHLAPAADMTYSVPSMKNSFLMTNISPQTPGCNRGIWKRLESQVRRWAVTEEKLYVITGPIFPPSPAKMGKTNIPVPIAFYKVILDLTPPMKMIGFIAPNETSKRRIASFAVTVDEVERITGYDFFSELDDCREAQLEKQCDITLWR